MTQIDLNDVGATEPTVSTGDGARRSPVLSRRGWLWAASLAVLAAQASKFPAMRGFVSENLHRAPDVSGLDPAMLQTALTFGSALGLVVGAACSLLALNLVHRHAPGLSAAPGGKALPFWLSGVALVGLVVPDLVAASTGQVMVTTMPVFYAVYLPVAAVAVWAAPGPRVRRLRVVDVLLLGALPFV